MNFYESLESWGLEWKWLNDKIEEDVLSDRAVPDTNPMELLPPIVVHGTQDTSAVESRMVSPWRNVESELTRTEYTVNPVI